tara:strand:- start:1984 stop:2127 length:144 start_codon:yes stop_codon:yes gene_type:complete
MITHELTKIWITSDGKRFLCKTDATIYEEALQQEKEMVEQLKEKWNS